MIGFWVVPRQWRYQLSDAWFSATDKETGMEVLECVVGTLRHRLKSKSTRNRNWFQFFTALLEGYF